MSDGGEVGPRPVTATYRVQLGANVDFDSVRALVPYFAALGISHLYLSPVLKARPGSAHGYDIVDHASLNPEIGDEQSFARLAQALHAAGMGVILDVVPNHMGVGGADNAWWLSVLEWGEASPYAEFFDIDWRPADVALRGRVLVPCLGDHYGRVLERGELSLRFARESASFSVWYYDHRLPVAVRDYARLLARADRSGMLAPLVARFAALPRRARSPARRASLRAAADELRAGLARLVAARPEIGAAIEAAVAKINGEPGRPESFRDLHALLERQAWRVAFWGVASDRINYRRFFDINDLAGVRVERPEVFEAVHRLVFRLVGDGKVDGLRIDHVDGLYDPLTYLRRVRERARPVPVWVEKILAGHERLRDDWRVAGTTGYEVLNLISGLFVDAQAERPLTRLYRRFTGRAETFDQVAIAAKMQIAQQNLASELSVLASDLDDLARQSWSTRDLTYNGLRDALIAVVAHFPVYRTYVTGQGCDNADRHYLDWAHARARKRAVEADPVLFDFLYGVLTGDLARARPASYRRADVTRAAMKFQQFTGPVMAKAVEDTALYRYHRFVALNEVGGEPDRFGVSDSAFHHVNLERLRRRPESMATTATHDTKRGEDARARLAVLSEMPAEWGRAVHRWARLNRARKRVINDAPEPDRNVEYLLYQTLVGAWPPGLAAGDHDGLAAFSQRMCAYMIKAAREAKEQTSWRRADADYESALASFTRTLLEPDRSAAFLADLHVLVRRIAPAGAVNGLAQSLLRLTVPGVPDTYQGNELWDHDLVDPDNRRAVDFDGRRRRLEAFAGEPIDLARMTADWTDGAVKLYVIWKTLTFRRAAPELFAAGEYVPVAAEGARAGHVVAFLRRGGGRVALVAVPRLALALLGPDGGLRIADGAFDGTALALPDLAPGSRLRNLFDGPEAVVGIDGALAVAPLFETVPVALLSGEPGQ